MTTQTVTLRLVAQNGELVGTVRAGKAEVAALGGAADQTRGQFKRLSDQSNQTGRQLLSVRDIAKDLARGLATGLGISGLIGTMAGATGVARQYGKSIAEVSTLLDDTSSMASYSAELRAQAREFGTAATEQSAALYQIFSSGQAGAKGIEVLTAANRLAIGGVTDIRTAADGLTSVLNAYGDRVQSAADVSDILFVGMRQGKTTIGELSGSLGTVAPIAASLGVEFGDLVASISAVTLGGVKTAEAVTQVRGVLSGILKPSSEASELATKLGLEFNAQALAAKGLSGFLADVVDKTGGNKEAMSQLFGSVEALGAVFALTANGGATFNATLEAMENRTGQTEVAFGKMSKSADFALNRMKSAAADSLISLGDRLLTVIAPAALVFADNIETITDAIVTGTTIAAAYFALFVAAPAIYTAVTVAGWAFVAMLTATNAGLLASITSIGVLKSAALVLFAAFAGWEIGSYIRENFLIAQRAGIAFVEYTLVGWERIKQGAAISWEATKAIATGALNFIREQFAEIFGALASGASSVGLDSLAAGLENIEAALKPSKSAAAGYAAAVATIDAETNTAIAGIREITGDMADYAIESFTAAKAAKESAGGAKEQAAGINQVAAATGELTEAQKEALKAAEALAKARLKANQTAAEEVAQLRQINDLIRDGIDAQLAEQRVRNAARGIDPETTRQLEEQQARNELLVKGQREAAGAGVTAAAQTASAWYDASDDIRESLTDAIYRGFEDGKGIVDNFVATLKNTIGTLVLRPVIEMLVSPIAGGLSSLLGIGGGAGGGLGTLTSMVSKLSNLPTTLAGFSDAFFTNVVKVTDAVATAFPSLNSAAASIQNAALRLGPAVGALTAALGGFAAGSFVGGLFENSSQFSSNTSTYAGIGGGLGAVVGSIIPGLGTLVGGAIGTALGTALGGVIGGSWKTKAIDLVGTIVDTVFDAEIVTRQTKKRLGSSKRRFLYDDATELDEAINQVFGDIYAQAAAAAQALGRESIGSFTFEFKESIKGLDDAEIQAKIEALLGRAADALAQQILPGIADFQREGESLYQTLQRVTSELLATRAGLALIGQSLPDYGDLFNPEVRATLEIGDSEDLLSRFQNGIEGFSTAVSSYFDAFFTDAEKFDATAATLRNALTQVDEAHFGYALSLNGGLPASREAYRTMLEGLNLSTERGRDAFAVLTQLSGVADEYYTELEQREKARLEELNKVAEREAELAREREQFDSAYADRLQRQGLGGLDLDAFNVEAEYAAAIAEAQRLGADLSAVESFFQGERNRIARTAAEQQLAQEQAEAAERARVAQVIAQERTGLERQLLEVMGNTAALRELDRAALDESNRALFDRVNALRDQQAAAEAAAQVEADLAAQRERETQERAGLERQLLEVLGDTAALRALDRAALDESNRALFDRIQTERDLQAASAAAAQVEADLAALRERQAQERAGLERQLLEVLGDTSALRALDRAALDESNRALFDRIQTERDLQAATAAAAQAEADLAAQREREAQERDLQAATAAAAQAEADLAAQREREAQERAGLERQLLEVLGDSAALRELDRAALAESNRALFDRIQAERDLQAATAAAAQAEADLAAQREREAQERAGLERQLLEVLGDSAALREQDRAALAESNRALFDHINALRDGQAAAEAAAQRESELAAERDRVTQQRTGLERQLLEVLGDTAALRAQDRAALDESNRALFDHINALRDSQAAAEAAAQRESELAAERDRVTQQRTSLERQLLEVLGDTAALRAQDRAALDESNRALFDHINALRDSQAAAQASAQAEAELAAQRERVAQQREGLERQLLEVLGDTAALRELEREALDESNRSLFDRINTIKDQQVAAQASAEAARNQRDAAREAAESLNRLREALQNAGKAVTDEIDRLRGNLPGGQQASAVQLQSQFAIATAQARAGNVDALTRLPEISQALEAAVDAMAASSFESQSNRAYLASSLAETLRRVGIGSSPLNSLPALAAGSEPVRIPAFSTGGLVRDDRAIVVAIDGLRADQRAQNRTLVDLQSELNALHKKWELDGLPEERTI